MQGSAVWKELQLLLSLNLPDTAYYLWEGTATCCHCDEQRLGIEEHRHHRGPRRAVTRNESACSNARRSRSSAPSPAAFTTSSFDRDAANYRARRHIAQTLVHVAVG